MMVVIKIINNYKIKVRRSIKRLRMGKIKNNKNSYKVFQDLHK